MAALSAEQYIVEYNTVLFPGRGDNHNSVCVTNVIREMNGNVKEGVLGVSRKAAQKM